jgi:hypothetical protein
MKKFTYYEFERFKRCVLIDKEDDHLLYKACKILELNLKENGVELLLEIMNDKKWDIEILSRNTAISVETLSKVIRKEQQITSGIAVNLTALGYPRECFLKK